MTNPYRPQPQVYEAPMMWADDQPEHLLAIIHDIADAGVNTVELVETLMRHLHRLQRRIEASEERAIDLGGRLDAATNHRDQLKRQIVDLESKTERLDEVIDRASRMRPDNRTAAGRLIRDLASMS